MKKNLINLLVAGLLTPLTAIGDDIDYPDGYRDWSHVKSMVIEQGHPLFDTFGGIHHIYANPAALDGYRSGTFADGSVIVFDLLEALGEDSSLIEGERKVLGVMQKDSGRFGSTAGWGFEAFAGGDRTRPVVGADAATACFACHTSRENHDYVFSQLRD